MPSVDVRLYAALARYAPAGNGGFAADIRPDETVGSLLDRLGVPAKGVRLIFVDSRQQSPAHPLQGGEHIGIFPAIAGG